MRGSRLDNIKHKVYNGKYKGEIITIIKQWHVALKNTEKGEK